MPHVCVVLEGFIKVLKPHRRFSIGRSTPAYQGEIPTQGVKPILFYSVFAALLTTNVLTLVAFLMSSDITSLARHQTDYIQAAYQDRIIQLRQDVDRLHSRQYAQAGNLNLQLQELSVQQDVLNEQHNYVKALAVKAQELGLKTATLDTAEVVQKTLVTGAAPNTRRGELPDIGYVSEAISQMMTENRLALSALSEAAIVSTDTIIEQLDAIGIEPDLPSLSPGGVGGPFEPARDETQITSLLDDANAVAAAFERFRVARDVAALAPVQRPLIGNARISSNFGNRKDPFLKRSAFHAGMDFAAPSGTPVVSAGPGKIIFAGRKSGYGKVVEVQHIGGLVTRYAHLSAYVAKAGQHVEAGTIIAKVGSTGRSTGPHLHFEVRKSDTPVNPAKFLKVGTQLARFL